MVSHFGELIRVEREGEEEEGEENQRNVWKFRFLYGKIMDFSMKCLEFVYATLDECLYFCMGKSNHKLIFDKGEKTIWSLILESSYG